MFSNENIRSLSIRALRFLGNGAALLSAFCLLLLSILFLAGTTQRAYAVCASSSNVNQGGGDCISRTADEVALAAYTAGFRGGALVNAIAISNAESSGISGVFYLNAILVNSVTSIDRGLWQINSHFWPNYDPQKLLFDASYNAAAAYTVYSTTSNGWCNWVEFYDGNFASYMSSPARIAAQKQDSTVIRFLTEESGRVRATANVRVRSSAGGAELRVVNAGATGTVVGGPTILSFGTCPGALHPYYYVWWQINWDDGASGGWSVEEALERTGTPTCTYSIAPVGISPDANPTNGSVAVTTTSGCNWTAASNASWITITSGSSGSGSGTAFYSVAANTGAARSGTATIAGQTFTVNQAAAACSYSISPTNTSVGAGVSTGSAAVTTASGCGWTAASNASWITVSPSSGSGNGTVSYSVAANTGVARSSTATIAGQTFTVNQAAAACSYSISPTSTSVGAGASTGSVAVTAASGCDWTAASNASWITVSPGSGSGNGTVSYSVAANTGTARSGTATIAGQTFTVNQGAAAACSYSISPTSTSVGAGASNGSVAVTAASGCGWTAASNASWITVSPSSGSGNGTVSYSVAANTGTARSGTATIATQTFTVNQAAAGTPPNDNFASATPIQAGQTLTGTNVGATKETGEPVHNYEFPDFGGKSVWWKFTAQTSGQFAVSTCDSNLDTVLAVYTGNAVNTLTKVASNDQAGAGTPCASSNQSYLVFSAIAGTAYSIVVDGYNPNNSGAASGSISLRLSAGVCGVIARLSDFNNDGKGDVLFRNDSGAVGAWLLNGGAILSAATIATTPTEWGIAGTADLNGDHKNDLLWRHVSGAVGAWL
ncbi:MAG: hypothetical protein QOD40_1271, partial [Alphaproteobacteria bacterium]|nr:hypothetical protein [Alphaproteobacteria bacterium]